MDAPLQQLLEKLNARLANVEAKIGICGSSSPLLPASPRGNAAPAAAAAAVELSPQLVAYDEYVRSHLPAFVNVCKKLGEDTTKLGTITERAFDAQRAYLLMASQCKKPASPNPEHLKDLQACLKDINALRDNRSEFANHQNMVNEGIQALGWLCVEPAPKPFIESYIGGSDFWGNKIRVQFKTSNPDQIEFVTTFKALLTDLMAYVKAHHTTGVTWNPQGGDASKYTPSAAPAAAPAAAAAKPAAPGGAGINDVFAGIRAVDQSQGFTAGLRKVTKDMQTWRPEFKDGGAAAPAPAAKKAPAAPAAPVAKVAKTPVCEERNGNWAIENQVAGAPVTVSNLTIKQQVYVYGCDSATIILEGKAKNIVLDGCKKTKLLFDSAVSSIEIVNCKNVQVQCKGQVPSVAIDKTDGCLVYLSWEGRGAQIVTSKSSEMNVALPSGPDSDEMVEKAIPEQFVHKITDDLTVTSDVSDLSGGTMVTQKAAPAAAAGKDHDKHAAAHAANAAAAAAAAAPEPPPPEPAVVEVEPLPPFHLLRPGELNELLKEMHAPARIEALCRLLCVEHYDVNPRTLVWVDFCFGVLAFAIEDVHFSEPKALRLLHVANEIFDVSTRAPGGALPGIDVVYERFRACVRAAATTGGDGGAESRFLPVDVAQIVEFFTATFFRYFTAYQLLFQRPRATIEREIELQVETPLPPWPLVNAILISGSGPVPNVEMIA
ncbi:TPA: LOW QUALITY PROTEIN: hypothetical protein N0F65_001532 [Lagenidium giganteum]|uniref:C-CAP/cofactor C-like domain-containing protein n=1 Tax=Lagenidium giganteum TaxID=4803 RepID=A0AAV2Z115_9STRA|nr:TPA: LOW QUALITY PROTEIN: hypothetical protein N0F65_001532 [Lagenidium giganteum]